MVLVIAKSLPENVSDALGGNCGVY